MAGDDDKGPKDPPKTPGPKTPPPKTSFKPNKPKFGNVSEVAKDSWVTWTGGKPNADWTGSETPSPLKIRFGFRKSRSLIQYRAGLR